MIEKFEKKLKKTKPMGFVHGMQLSRVERIIRNMKKDKYDKEDIRYVNSILYNKNSELNDLPNF